MIDTKLKLTFPICLFIRAESSLLVIWLFVGRHHFGAVSPLFRRQRSKVGLVYPVFQHSQFIFGIEGLVSGIEGGLGEKSQIGIQPSCVFVNLGKELVIFEVIIPGISSVTKTKQLENITISEFFDTGTRYQDKFLKN